ncbi:transcription initiation factor TFIIF subunit alpha [Entomortierella parvispora]|uniref:Transcription initiation factor IIF subunit alpha n=1 Tax=Entomortierella parvispora TaxID=205924 RepID=A0A9P3HDM2_9FUNG|nr:transcription initiation factor TFIIF subunit alpha [Entomortierella parvispora]
MSFLVKRPPVQSNRQQRPAGLGSSAGHSSAGPPIKRKIEKPIPQPQPGTYKDYKLVSTSRDVLHHVMRFHGSKDVNPTKFNAPVKLNRKRNENTGYYRGYNYYNNNNNPRAGFNNQANKDNQAANAAGGADGAAGAAGEEKKPTGADTTLIAPYGGGVRNKQMLFKKRTRQIYLANEDERKKKEIESAPWVVEDYDHQNSFTGQLEGGQHANYVLFVFAADGFKVVPADKWYKFSSKLQYATLTAEEAEEQYQKSQKQNNSIRWLMRSKKAKVEDGEEGGEDGAEGEQFMAVDHEDDGGYDEDEAKERKRKRGKHGDADEMDFDEDWQDDEEAPVDMPGFDDDAKDDPRRKPGVSAMDSDEDEDEEEKKGLTETGKQIKKALLKHQKTRVYASDDDKDPYASDKDSSDSDLDEIDKEKEGMNVKEEEELRLQDLTKTKKKAATNTKNAPLIAKKASAAAKPSPKPVSAKVVKPKVPMPNPRNASAGLQANGKGAVSSAAASSSSSAGRAHSPTPVAGARSVSPPAATSGRASSPGADKKRRKMEGVPGETSDDGAVKKQNQASGSGTVSAGDDSMLITESEVVSLLKSRPQMTTRDLINDLKRKLRKEPRNKGILAQIVKKVASSQDGILNLKEGF